MSVLSDGTIREKIEAGEIGLMPYDPRMIQPASIDVRLGNQFRVLRSGRQEVIDPYEFVDNMELTTMEDGEPFVLHPADFVLGTTFELVTVPHNLVCRIEGKSSIGRLGLLIHTTAGFVDPGFSGHVTLEFANLANMPMRLYPGMKIGQLSFMYLDKAALAPYGSGATGSKYQDQTGPVASRYHENEMPDFDAMLRELASQLAEASAT